MKSYIVRIYRNERGDRRNFVGTVEEPDVGGKKAFTNLDELWGILNRVAKRTLRARGKANREPPSGKSIRQRDREKRSVRQAKENR
jgi:hypothetical protein